MTQQWLVVGWLLFFFLPHIFELYMTAIVIKVVSIISIIIIIIISDHISIINIIAIVVSIISVMTTSTVVVVAVVVVVVVEENKHIMWQNQRHKTKKIGDRLCHFFLMVPLGLLIVGFAALLETSLPSGNLTVCY